MQQLNTANCGSLTTAVRQTIVIENGNKSKFIN